MPRAAWCSLCGMYQWVNADGTCANGHPAECLSSHHDVAAPGYPSEPPSNAPQPKASVPAEKPSRWLPVLLVAVGIYVLVIVCLTAASEVAILTHAGDVFRVAQNPTASNQDAGDQSAAQNPDDVSADASDTTDDAGDTASDGTTDSGAAPPAPAPPRHIVKTSDANVAAPALDAFIARQYPGYQVEKRISFPNQWDKGRLGVNYLLVNKRHPKFRLLVGVAAAEKGEDIEDPNSDHYYPHVGRVFTDDEVFSADAPELYGILRQGAQDELAGAIADRLPEGGFVYGSSPDGVHVEFSVDHGAAGMDRAMQDSGTDEWGFGEALLPSIPGRDPVTVDLTLDNR